MTPSITEDQFNQALGNLLTSMLPQLVGSIVIGQQNRVASPEGDYAVFWPLRLPRLGTNLETPEDCTFIASIAPIDANTAMMTVTQLLTGLIEPDNQIFSVDAANNTVVKSQTSGPIGGAGTYIVTPSQIVSPAELMSAGAMLIEQSTEVVMQLDVHGPSSWNNAQVIETLMRSEFAVNQMDGTGIVPLYADEPRQMPFQTAAEQFENRWSIDLHFQMNPTISTPQEFADVVDLTLVDVDVVYPD